MVKLGVQEVEVLSYPNVSHESLVRKATQRKKPFSEKGEGYRDALIWGNVKEALLDDDPIYFITNDESDFYNKDGSLHSDLVDELKEKDICLNKLHIYNDLSKFNDDHVKPSLDELNDLKERISSGGHDEIVLDFLIEKVIIPKISEQQLSNRQIGLDDCFEEPSVISGGNIGNVNLLDVRRLSENEVVLWICFDMDATVGFFMVKGMWYALDSINTDLISPDWNERVVFASINVPLDCSAYISVNTDNERRRRWK